MLHTHSSTIGKYINSMHFYFLDAQFSRDFFGRFGDFLLLFCPENRVIHKMKPL